jgi:hypothetical protein
MKLMVTTLSGCDSSLSNGDEMGLASADEKKDREMNWHSCGPIKIL